MFGGQLGVVWAALPIFAGLTYTSERLLAVGRLSAGLGWSIPALLHTCHPPPGTNRLGQAWPSRGDGWQTHKRANPNSQAHFSSHYLYQIQLTYHQPSPVTIEPIFRGCGRSSCPCRESMHNDTEAMATGSDRKLGGGLRDINLPQQVKTLAELLPIWFPLEISPAHVRGAEGFV